jgi:hypothetical protein
MHSTPQPPTAAGEHFADAERILAAALPLVKRSADRDRHVQVSLVHHARGRRGPARRMADRLRSGAPRGAARA